MADEESVGTPGTPLEGLSREGSAEVVGQESVENDPETSGDFPEADDDQDSPTGDSPLEQDTSSEHVTSQELEDATGKRGHSPSDDDDSDIVSRKRPRLQGDASDDEAGESGDEGEGEEREMDELEAALLELEDEEPEGVSHIDTIQRLAREDSGESEVEDSGGTVSEKGMSDFDIMMQRRKDAMAKARKRRRKDIDVTTNDDHIVAMITQMKQAAEEDRRLNLQKKAAFKKLQMLPTVLSHLKKTDLFSTFIECGICSALADWLRPLPDHSFPHMKIREGILNCLTTFPPLDSHTLKISGLGKSVMLIYRHPKELKKNKEKAEKLINNWARPIFGTTTDFKSLNRDQREERDWAHLSQATRRRLSSGEGGPSAQTLLEEDTAQKPGDKGWVGRARVPMPSNKDYVVRPKWNVQHEMKKSSSKKVLNRYEKQLQKRKNKRAGTTHAVSISVEGRKMAL